jgi:hypothetical protein
MVIAAKTGWPEHFIRWNLPLSRGYAYFHAARLMEGETTCWPTAPDPVEQWVESIRQWAASGNRQQSAAIESNRQHTP